MSGPPAEPATTCQASRRHAGRTSLPPSISSVAAAVAPHRSWRLKPAAAYTKDVRPTNENSTWRHAFHEAPRTCTLTASQSGPNGGQATYCPSPRRVAVAQRRQSIVRPVSTKRKPCTSPSTDAPCSMLGDEETALALANDGSKVGESVLMTLLY